MNIARNYSVSTARVHRATCRTISGQNHAQRTVDWCLRQGVRHSFGGRRRRWTTNTVRKPIRRAELADPDTCDRCGAQAAHLNSSVWDANDPVRPVARIFFDAPLNSDASWA